MEALRDLLMVAAVSGLGMPGEVFSAQTLSFCQAFSIPYSKTIPSLQLTLPNPYPNREYGLVLLLGKVGL